MVLQSKGDKLANEQLLERLQQQIYADRGRLESGNQPIYPGKMISPMSSMTQNARDLRQQYANKMPKQGKISNLLTRDPKTFSPEQTRDMLNMLRRGDVSQQLALDRLQNQFGKNFGYEANRGNRLRGKIGKDIDQNVEMSKVNLKNASDDLKALEGKRSTKGASSLQKAAGLKTARRDALIKQLEDFGNQEHVLNNMRMQADKDSFEEERSAPFRKMDMATRALRGINVDETHPDKEQLQNQLLQKINNAYNQPYKQYPGQRVVGMEPDTETSFNIAQQINPKYKDAFAADRKTIEQDLLRNSLSDKIYDKLPASVDPLMRNLDMLARKQLKTEARNVGGHYARQGTYGSEAHKMATEQALRDVLRKVQAEREGALLSGVKDQRDLIGQEEANNMNRYDMMSEQGAKEFGNILQENERLNKEGWRKRANKQGEANQAMQTWYGQLANEWPTLNQGPTYRNVSMAPFEEMAKGYNTDLTGLFGQPALFSENEKAFNAYQAAENKKIQDYPSYIINSKRAQFDSQLAANLRRAQEQADWQAKSQANAAAREAADEANRNRMANSSQKDQAWQNYQNMANQAKEWFDFAGMLTPAGRNAPVDQRTKIFNIIGREGPGLPYRPYNTPEINDMSWLHQGHFSKNLGLTRQEFDANPATLGWASPQYKWG